MPDEGQVLHYDLNLKVNIQKENLTLRHNRSFWKKLGLS